MHIWTKDLAPGAWLMLDGNNVMFTSFASEEHIHVTGDDDTTYIVPLADLRPVYINRFIIERCGFKRQGEEYSNGLFIIKIGDAGKIFKITGHRAKRPFVTHLLSQLHIFQNIYRKETGDELIFNREGSSI